MRPSELDDVHGQEHLTGAGRPIRLMVDSGRAQSLILHGPPGTGKTTIARILARSLGLRHASVPATGSGVADLKKAFAEAEAHMRTGGGPTLLFIDEIHRFNRAQQDALLPHMESGLVVLVGATTENPSFEVNGAIISRSRVLELAPIGRTAAEAVLSRVEGENGRLPITPEARDALLDGAGGDARFLVGQAETLLQHHGEELDVEGMSALLSRRIARHDKAGDGHYDLASAFQKSVRGSDADAALYYAARMVDAGEDPAFIFRRLLVMASEEVGMAEPGALQTVVAARTTFDMIGPPEGWYALSQAIIHVATAPKSNASYAAWGAAAALAAETRGVPPPRRILNAPTSLMREQGRKEGYLYDHDHPNAFSGQDFWPDEVGPRSLYRPNPRGFEDKVRQRMEHWAAVRHETRRDAGEA